MIRHLELGLRREAKARQRFAFAAPFSGLGLGYAGRATQRLASVLEAFHSAGQDFGAIGRLRLSVSD